jgi:hypothetical protein
MDALVVMLDDLSDLQERLQTVQTAYAVAREAQIPATVRTALARVDAEYAACAQALETTIAQVAACLKQAVLERGASVKGTGLHAIYVKGRVTWDSRYLEIYAASHPEIQPARKEGQPSVSLRKVSA